MPESVRLSAFIQDHFRSVWTLEILLFLRNSATDSWSREQVVQSLRASDSLVSQSLRELVAGGLVLCDEDGAARFSPATADLEKLAADVDDLYTRKPGAVRRLIINSGTRLSAFSDSFRLRRD